MTEHVATFVLVFHNDERECELRDGVFTHVLNPSFQIAQDDSRILQIKETKMADTKTVPSPRTFKRYRCTQCGHVVEQETNHYGATWSHGHYNCCPKCPPYAKYPEFGGATIWECLDKPEKK
jgi:hypothetical protein